MILKATFRTPSGKQANRLASSIPDLLIDDKTADQFRPEFIVVGSQQSIMLLIGAMANEGEATLYDVTRV